MGGKDATLSIRVGADLKERLDRDHFNTSSLLRELAEHYLRMGDVVEVSLRRRLADAEAELKDKRLEREKLDNEIEKLERQVDELQAKIKQRQESVPEEVVEFAAKVRDGDIPRSNLDPENLAVQEWAGKSGLEVPDFIHHVEERL